MLKLTILGKTLFPLALVLAPPHQPTAVTLLGVAMFHHHTLKVALIGAAVITLYQLVFTGFKAGPGLGGLMAHTAHEWVTLANLLGLLLGFSLLADHFERSHLTDKLPHMPALGPWQPHPDGSEIRYRAKWPGQD